MRLVGLTDKQRVVLGLASSSDVRVNLWSGSVRSGKTVNSLVAWLHFMFVEQPSGALLMAGRTVDTLKRNVLDPLAELVGHDNVKVVRGDGKAIIFGRKVHLVGADNNSAESRIRGLTLVGSYCDELTILGGPHGEQWFNMLLSRHSLPGAKVFATTNPDHPNHWLLKNFISKASVTVDGCDPVRVVRHKDGGGGVGLFHYHFTLDDNPALPVEYVRALKASVSGVFYLRNIEGLWVAAEGVVFQNLVGLDGVRRLDEFDRFVVGVDVGTTNPTHGVLLGLSNVRREVVVLSECRVADRDLTYREHVELLVGWLDGLFGDARVNVPVVVDPSARPFRNEWRNFTGVWPRSAENSVLLGINDVGSLFGGGFLKVDDVRCPLLFGELQGYRWDESASSRGLDKPLKENDHGVDALRYGVEALKTFWREWLVVRPAGEAVDFVPRWMEGRG